MGGSPSVSRDPVPSADMQSADAQPPAAEVGGSLPARNACARFGSRSARALCRLFVHIFTYKVGWWMGFTAAGEPLHEPWACSPSRCDFASLDAARKPVIGGILIANAPSLRSPFCALANRPASLHACHWPRRLSTTKDFDSDAYARASLAGDSSARPWRGKARYDGPARLRLIDRAIASLILGFLRCRRHRSRSCQPRPH